MKKVGAEIHVEGRVQGVWYRAFAETHATRLGVTGFCENLRDGRVRVVVEGERPLVDEFIMHLGKGPPAADVGTVDVRWTAWTGAYPSFRIES